MRGTLCIMMAILLSSIINQPTLMAQSEGIGCGTSKAMEELYRTRPGSREKAQEFNRFTEVFNTSQAAQKTAASSYTIPVVFHVFGTDFLGDVVTQSIIEDALQKTNEDFNGLNNDWGDVSALFSGIKSTLDIEFKLAKIDPNGNATTGITFNPVLSGFGNGSGYDAQIQQYAWDNYKYMNIYIMLDLYNDGTTNRSGVAWYPDDWMSNNNLARVVYNGRYIGSNTDENFRRVLTHEFGHYLNLAHTFDNDCAAPGDNVSDTPATTSNSGTCNYTIEKCTGAGPANGENFMDYSECYRMFTAGQVSRMEAALNHSTRQPLWQASNLDATGVNGIGAHLLLSTSSYREDQSNNGLVSGNASITTANGASFATTGTLTEGVHYTTSNIPNGLDVTINVSNNSTASFTISGSASNHAASNSANNLSITFLNPAISGGVGSLFSASMTFSIDFIDPYQIVYENMADETVNATDTWKPFTISLNGNKYGAWYDDGDLRFETYLKSMICEGTSRNLTRLSSGTPISAASNWVAGGAYPDEHNLRTSSYSVWDGQTGYIGFQAPNSLGWDVHGWFRVSVSASGNEYTVLDYAYNEDPNGTITAGQTTGNAGNPPVAAFSASATTIDAGQSVTFSDESTNSPTSWNWTFTGGTPSTSTDQNPQVTYNTAGTYAVTLEATNADGNNSLTKSNHITVNPVTGPNYCESSGSRVQYEWIAGVQVGSLNHTSGAQLYSDFTAQTVDLARGQGHSITLTPGFSGSAYNEYFKVWIDYNQDGDFDDAGESVFDAGSASNSAVNGTITPDASVALGSTRMRVSMKYNSAPSPCGSIGDGEVEDYTVNITGTTNPPADYCDVTNGAPSGQYIKQVEIGQIDNSTTYDASGYSDFTSQSTTISNGTSITVTPHNTWSGTNAKAWIDWNQDGDFDDANEEVLSGSGSGGSYSANITVPSSASNGTTRLRVRTLYGGTPNPCGTEYFSEVEDYSVSVNSGSAGPEPDQVVSGTVKMYPNPFNDHINIDLSSFTEDHIQVSLFDLTGAIRYQEIITRSDNRLQIGANLEGGFYVLQIKTERLREVHHIVKVD